MFEEVWIWLLYRKYVTATAEVQTSSKISLNLEQRSLICYDVLTELFFYYYKKRGVLAQLLPHL